MYPCLPILCTAKGEVVTPRSRPRKSYLIGQTTLSSTFAGFPGCGSRRQPPLHIRLHLQRVDDGHVRPDRELPRWQPRVGCGCTRHRERSCLTPRPGSVPHHCPRRLRNASPNTPLWASFGRQGRESRLGAMVFIGTWNVPRADPSTGILPSMQTW